MFGLGRHKATGKSTYQVNGGKPTPGYVGRRRRDTGVPKGVTGIKVGTRTPTDQTGGRYSRTD